MVWGDNYDSITSATENFSDGVEYFFLDEHNALGYMTSTIETFIEIA